MPDPNPVPPTLRDTILAWYGTRGRSLPFRGTSHPYGILVSEAMAQQTQAARAGEAWTRFMTRFPTVESLAAAAPADVLRAWQGLGYNRRALNLWKAARVIVDEHGGRVPADLVALEALPGVGPYTARAVAAIAFAMPVGAVDTNVRRVLGRIVAGETAASVTPAEMQRLADDAVPRDRPGAWTHALMDLGATVCAPRRPDCAACPARQWCRFASEVRMAGDPIGQQLATASTTHVTRAAAVPFVATSRWLRGRILDRLRIASDGEWVVLDRRMGQHDRPAIETALHALARDGLVELDVSGAEIQARLPIA